MLKRIAALIGVMISISWFIAGVQAAEPDGSLRVVVFNDQVAVGGELTPAINEALNDKDYERVAPELVGQIQQEYQNLPVVSATLTDAEVENLRANPAVASVVENQLFRPTLDTSIPIINADDAHTAGFDGTGWAVAILDTGVDNDHTFLNVISEACYSNASGFGGGTSLCPGGATSSTAAESADDCVGVSSCDHGTHVAGIAAGDGDGAAFTGVAKDASIIAIQVFTRYDSAFLCSPSSPPCLLANTSDIIAGLDRVLTLHNSVSFTTPIAAANLSLGGGAYSSESACDAANAGTKSAIDDLRAVNIATVIAAGNDGSSTHISTPGCISTAIAVGATTDADAVPSFSNSNSLVDLLAPGSDINSSVPGGTFASKSGTSMDTPHVTGAWAVLRDAAANATVDNVLAALKNSGVSVTDARNGLTFPRIDVNAALQDENLLAIKVTTVNNTTSENGDTALVRISLSTQPSANVTIPLSVSDSTEGTLSGVTEIVVTPANWDQPQNNQITVSGVDDSAIDGNVVFQVVTGDPTSTDTLFNSLTANDVPDASIVNYDDEQASTRVAFGDTNGDGIDEAHLVRFNGTGSGMIEIHTWNSDYSDWLFNRATNHPQVTPGAVDVVFGDTNGDNVDEAHLIGYSNTGSGLIEIHTWNNVYNAWASNRVTNHPLVTVGTADVVFGDRTNDGRDEAHLVGYTGTGSGKIEIHTWNNSYTGWLSNHATNHPVIDASVGQVQFGDTEGLFNDDLAHLLIGTATATGDVEIHRWNPGYASWRSNSATIHPWININNSNILLGDTNGDGRDEAHLIGYNGTGSGSIEIHTFNIFFNGWAFNRATNHPAIF